MVALATPFIDYGTGTGQTVDYATTYRITINGSTATATNYGGTGDTLTVPTTWKAISKDYDVHTNGLITQTLEFYTGTAATATNYYQIGNTLEQITGNGLWEIVDNGAFAPDRRSQLRRQHRHVRRLRGNPSFVDTLSPAEVKALQLLRSLVTPENFRRYLKYGFVIVKGMSGLTYNVYRRKNAVVFDGQNQVASLCVHLSGNKVPTDEVIAKILMCECDEHEIWRRSNRYFRTKTPKIMSLGFDKLPRAA
jgi:hypothetical protein